VDVRGYGVPKKAGGVPPTGNATLIARALKYLAAATRAANDKSQRVARGEVVSEILAEAATAPVKPTRKGRGGSSEIGKKR